MGHTIAEASAITGLSTRQIRRYIKGGKLQAVLQKGEYVIDRIPDDMHAKDSRGVDYTALLNRLEQLNQEAGYWRARAEIAEGRVKLLEAPRMTGSWWGRLFRGRSPRE